LAKVLLGIIIALEYYEANRSTSFQAKYDDETAQLLAEVRADMLNQLLEAGRLKVLQDQFMVVLLLKNYLDQLQAQQRLALEASSTGDGGNNVGRLSNTVRILVEMLLQDPECPELEEVRRILVGWRNKFQIKRHYTARYTKIRWRYYAA